MIKLICCDVDGTLLNKEREIDLFTKEVFHNLIGKVEFILASSRMPKALYHIQKDLGIINSPLICYNGALVLSGGSMFSNDQVLFTSTMPRETIEKLVKLAEKAEAHMSIYFNDTWITAKQDFWTEREINNTKVNPNIIFDNYPNDFKLSDITEAHKIMIMGEEKRIDALENEIRKNKKVALCRSKETYLEITPMETNKSKGLYFLLNSIARFSHVTSENIMAFGDNHNDLELLKDVKYGIAVENATSGLKDIAYSITKSNIENGVAHYLKDFFS